MNYDRRFVNSTKYEVKMVNITINKEKYDWRITLRKGFFTAVEIFIVGAIAFAQEDARYLAIVPVLEMVRNYLKHK
jgi:hypothetical protein